MLEVGLVEGPLSWNRAHFGGWAVSSSPLVLGADLSDSALLSTIAPIITNTEAIAVNQAWAGHPGRLIGGHGYGGKYPVVQDCSSDDPSQRGWAWDANSGVVHGPGGLCLDNRSQGVYHGAAIPQPEVGQMQLRACDGPSRQHTQHTQPDLPVQLEPVFQFSIANVPQVLTS